MQNKKTIDKRSVPKTIYDRLLTEDTRIVEEWSRMLALGFKPGSRKEGRVKGRHTSSQPVVLGQAFARFQI